jgi:hypothetical protein
LGQGRAYSSSGEVVWARRDSNVERRLYDPSGTASLFSNALSSCSFVNDEKYPLEAIMNKKLKCGASGFKHPKSGFIRKFWHFFGGF